MVAYSFKGRFAEPIRTRAKFQTIRADRKRHARPGETLQLYTGMRTRSCKLIASATCVNVAPIRLTFGARHSVELFGRTTISRAELDHFAVMDGFADWHDMRLFWAVAHPAVTEFEGVLVRWAPETLILPDAA
jgi:hypothetical protein